jgi:nucleoside-diphosphate-sugar epimerase
MKILVTGGAGFIGTNVCEVLIKDGHTVRVIDNLSVSAVNVPYLEALGVEIENVDIVDYLAIKDLFVGFDAVVHLAAMNRAQRSIEDPLQANKVNVEGTLNCLEASRQAGVQKFINISSSSVYANKAGELLQEDSPLAPLHPYGIGKLTGEQYARIYFELYGLKTVSLRLFSVYGPRQLGSIDKAGVVAKFIHYAAQGLPIEIYGSGEQLRNFSYVEDVVACIVRSLQNEKAVGEIINIANSREVTVNYLANTVKEISKKDISIVHAPALSGDPKRNPANVAKCEALLGYTAQYSFEDGLQKTFDWYVNQSVK